MATIKQIEANRLNAKKSTGPRSLEGKAVTRMNAVKTGIDARSHLIRGEDPAALEALVLDYHERWNPTTPEQRALVDTLVDNEWLLRRLRKTEAQIWELEFRFKEKFNELKQDTPLAQVFLGDQKTFDRLQRRIDSAERNYHRALKQLERIDAQPPATAPHPDPPAADLRPPQSDAQETAYPSIGFVPQVLVDAPFDAPNVSFFPTRPVAADTLPDLK
jgi:hypothetical protein